ncbi:TetR/AcrR family transcriptional regulator [Cellulomonas sp. URHE0023]|uniref:TetR/AcrR family transcriptional regulator n=1 Tax=Cellulomonas sp. URHE0023 TaxID=1380354 RepID=UPI0004826CB9|nr:TetR/AcrR family transcriptional regulator C-terminal domain-containing protein [Cellulomonas sp. URHE0023]
MPNPGGSRRDRPAKPALSLQWIVAETIKIIRTEGLERATMRRVAQALDTGPASLYVYVANTAELHAAVLDELIGATEPEPGDWMARLQSVLGSYADVLFTYPGLARSALVLRPTGPHALRLYDQVLGLLLEGGIAVERAAWGVDLLLQHVTATAAEHSAPARADVDAPPDGAAQMDVLRGALRGADPVENPHVAAHAEALLAGTPAQRQAWAIRALVQGIATTPTQS